jgi:hypothetical protein
MINEKMKRKLESNGLEVEDWIQVSRNAVKRARKNANRTHGGHILFNELSLGHTRDLRKSADTELSISQYSETAQQIKMRKAEEKRARRAGK